ncbi:hypothetical protein MNB_SV-14-1261 [hydrothermal vent metagenome]|uniref:Uncharacterized protein n=1 Tax=hydrothermal vent metagenome TaxID=652676 RepID=A0A1W1CRM6_9ZZZZ
MKVYIVKHYWKDGENATWESHENIDKKIFEYLKKNYHSFVENRQNTIKEGNHYIYPCYEDGVDIYSRKLTNITFFVSKSEIDEELCNKEYHDLEISLAGKRNKLIFYLVGLVVIVGLLFGYYYSNKQKSLDKKSTTNSSEKEEINIEINKEFQDINLSVKDINLTFITNKRKIIDKKIEGKEKLLNYENNCSVNKLRDFISINEKIQDLDTCIKNKEEIDKCKKDLKEIQIEYKDKNFIKQSIELLNIYIESLVKKKIKG